MAEGPLVECVANVSEGRREAVIRSLGRTIERVPGCCLLDVHSDVDHNRSVFTFAGSPDAVSAGALALAGGAIEMVDMRSHSGVHPRAGALDVVPFIPLGGYDMAQCVALARETAEALASTYGVPAYLYAAAAAPGRPDTLAEIRRGGFEGLTRGDRLQRPPDYGPQQAHPTAGVVSVGARDPLVAFNLLLDSRELTVARGVAAAVRESNHGLSGVQAIGLYLPSRDHAQVSMNLLDFETTPLDYLVEAVSRSAAKFGAAVVEAELVGLAPLRALQALASTNLPGSPDASMSIEARLKACAR